MAQERGAFKVNMLPCRDDRLASAGTGDVIREFLPLI
jgi:hypothetical protein